MLVPTLVGTDLCKRVVFGTKAFWNELGSVQGLGLWMPWADSSFSTVTVHAEAAVCPQCLKYGSSIS